MSDPMDYTSYYASMLSTKTKDPELVQYQSNNNSIQVFDKSNKALFQIKLPVYKLTRVALEDHRAKRTQLVNTLAFAKDALVMGDTKPASNYFQDYKKAWEQLEKTKTHVATLYNSETERTDSLRREAITTHGEIAEHLKLQLDTVAGMADMADEVERALQAEKHGRRKKDFDVHAKMDAQKRAEYAMFSSFYTTVKPAMVVKENTEKAPPPPAPAPTVSKPAVAMSSKTKKRAATTTTEAKTNMVKHILLSSFPFKSRDECVSKKRLAEYYMTKEDIVKVISQSAEMRASVPSNYKSLKKEELCDALFPVASQEK
jgi:hypothetical protein